MKKPNGRIALLLCSVFLVLTLASCSIVPAATTGAPQTAPATTAQNTTELTTAGTTAETTAQGTTAATATAEPTTVPETTAPPPATTEATTVPETTAPPPATTEATTAVTTELPPDPETFTPVLRFLVASDIHYTDTVDAQDAKLKKMLSDAYAFSDAQTSYQTLDGVFFVGDISHRGTAASFNRFFSDLYENTRTETTAQAVLGNHEFWPEPNYAVSRYLTASGYESADRHIVIAGYHFILMCPSHYEGFNDAKIEWLEEQIEIAAADDPTGKKPIFVFQHHPPYDTVYGSEDEWGVTNLSPVFSKYPQVVDFAGHSHFPINDPRSVWQGSYTAFNTGSCREWGMDLAGVTAKTVFASNDRGDWTFDENATYLYDPGKYYIVEVDAYSRILVRAFDVGTGVEVIDPIFLESVGDPEAFAYTDDRANDEETPRFAENAEVETVSITSSAATFLFPRTVSGAYVQHYRCELRRGETLIDTALRLDCGFLFPAPETLTLSFTGLDEDTEYTLSIIPVTSWENEGEPLVFTFTTPAFSPLVFSAAFGADGTATDGVSGTEMTVRGDPTTVYNEATGAYYAVFDGNDAFEFYGIAPYQTALTQAFTFETYLCMDQKPASGVAAPFSNQEGGGYGFEYDPSGRMDFWIKVNGTWISAYAAIETDEWVHLVATFDGSNLILYVDGVEACRTSVSGTPALPNADHLSIGADSKGNIASENFAVCKVATANVYQVAKTAEEVADLYAVVNPD